MNPSLFRFPAAALMAASACLASFDPKDMDLSASPKVDFYQYAEGGWMKANPVPADRSQWGSFDELEAHNERILRGILDRATAAPGDIRDAARACLRRVPLDRPLRLLGIRLGTLVLPEEAAGVEVDPFGAGAARVSGMLVPID